MLGGALRKAVTVTMLPDGRRGRPFLRNAVSTAAGIPVSSERSLTAAAVYGATTLTADTMAAFPVRFLERGDESRTPVLPDEVKPLTGERTNSLQTPFDFVQTVYMSMLLWGEAFIFIQRLNSGDAGALWPIDPERILDVERLDGARGSIGLRFRVEGWDEGDGWVENRPGRPARMMHIPMHTLPGQIRGLSPIRLQAELVGMSLSSQEHAARFLGDGVHMSGVIQTASDLEPDDARELVDNFNLMHTGPKRTGRVGVLTGGATFTSVTAPPKELQFLEQMKLTDSKIGSAIYRVPPHLMGDVERSTSWGRGIEEQTHNWVKFRLIGLARKLESQVEATLLSGTGVQMRMVMNGLLRGVAKDRAEFYRILWNLGALSQDEIRAFEDMAPLPDGQGDGYRVPSNTEPIEDSEERMAALESRLQLLADLVEEGR